MIVTISSIAWLDLARITSEWFLAVTLAVWFVSASCAPVATVRGIAQLEFTLISGVSLRALAFAIGPVSSGGTLAAAVLSGALLKLAFGTGVTLLTSAVARWAVASSFAASRAILSICANFELALCTGVTGSAGADAVRPCGRCIAPGVAVCSCAQL